ASVTRPVIELKGFIRVSLAAGESRSIAFTTPLGQLGFHDRDLAYVVEPGQIDVFVGTSAADLVEVGSVTVLAEPGDPPTKHFDGTVTVV
ncbi:MAG TPA: fibronectin type III-like domain-contianing protein, partial [Desertimonas sp.]|nr:fibronectin type III-like domain-contianing protein [Desertimonas sp.]